MMHRFNKKVCYCLSRYKSELESSFFASVPGNGLCTENRYSGIEATTQEPLGKGKCIFGKGLNCIIIQLIQRGFQSSLSPEVVGRISKLLTQYLITNS